MEEGPKLNISELLLNRLVAETSNVTLSSVEKTYLKEIFSEDFYLSEKFPLIEQVSNSISIIDRNFYYDIYKFSYENLSYCIKIGEKIDQFIFDKEKKALELIKDLNLSPLYFNTSSSENYSYLLTSFENSQSTKELGLSYTYEHIEMLASALAKIHNHTKQDENERDYFLDSMYTVGDFENTMSIELFNSLKKINIFPECQDLLNSIKNSIELQKFPNGERYSCLCHTNINPGCILNRPSQLKICNFYQSFFIHPAWDLAFASYKLQLNEHPIYEKRFLDAYHKESFLKENEYSYTFYKQLTYKIILHNLVSSYFYKLTTAKEEMDNLLTLFQQYSTIREVIQDEFAEYMPTLDDMFAPFIKNI